MTGNFAHKKVKNPVVTVYGTRYDKIPSPLDFNNFWKEELLDVFDKFFLYWQKISHGIPIAGIFFDFEMYHAQQQSGHYTTLMDFSDCAWHVYSSAVCRPYLKNMKTINDKTNYLMKNKLFDHYFKVLEQEAYKIGKRIRAHLKRKAPHLLVGIYDIFLPHNWFYKGMLAGLSTSSEPVLLATFNNDFYSHYSWLEKNNIYAFHMAALLLGKFKKVEDFDLINDVAQYHDGIWFNRISRLEESRDPKDWGWNYGVEVTPLPTECFVDHLAQHIEEVQQKKTMCR